MDELNRPDSSSALVAEKSNISILLEDIRSMDNVGSFFRSADAFAIKNIYLTGITGQPPHRNIERSALGATESVTWYYSKDSIQLIKDLKNDGCVIIAAEQTDKSINMNSWSIDSFKDYVIIFGNEVDGVSQELLEQCDGIIEIMQSGAKHSLNVSVSGGIVMQYTHQNWLNKKA